MKFSAIAGVASVVSSELAIATKIAGGLFCAVVYDFGAGLQAGAATLVEEKANETGWHKLINDETKESYYGYAAAPFAPKFVSALLNPVYNLPMLNKYGL